MLNKPKGYISATEDRSMQTVLELVPKEYLHRDLFPAGRLDKDTTGLMLITDDGEFAHNILSPKKHVKKTYNVEIDIPMTEEMVEGFKKGVMFSPMIGTIPFVGYIFTVEDGEDVNKFIENLEKNADKRWNICTEADEMVVSAEGNTVFFVMSPSKFEE
jgi:16S rRNA pseudouridine516 synthase